MFRVVLAVVVVAVAVEVVAADNAGGRLICDEGIMLGRDDDKVGGAIDGCCDETGGAICAVSTPLPLR